MAKHSEKTKNINEKSEGLGAEKQKTESAAENKAEIKAESVKSTETAQAESAETATAETVTATETNEAKKAKRKKQNKWKTLSKKAKGFIIAGICVFLAIVIIGITFVSVMFAARSARRGNGDYKDLAALKSEYALTEAEAAKTVADYEWLSGNAGSTETADKAAAFEIFKKMYINLLAEENVQSITDGKTVLAGGLNSTVQNNKKKIGDKIFVNIYGESIVNTDERHYFDIAKSTVVTKNTSIKAGFKTYNEEDYVANYFYQPALLHHVVSSDDIVKAYLRKVDGALIAKRNGLINSCKSSQFQKNRNELITLENYDKFSSGEYYEVLLYLDSIKSSAAIQTQVASVGNAKKVDYFGEVGFAFVIDSNFRIVANTLHETYRLDSPFRLSFASGNASSTTYEFYYYGDDIKGSSNGAPTFLSGIESEGFLKM